MTGRESISRLPQLVCAWAIGLAVFSSPASASAQRDTAIIVDVPVSVIDGRVSTSVSAGDVIWIRPDGRRAHVVCGRFSRCSIRHWFGGPGVYRVGLSTSPQYPTGLPVELSGREYSARVELSAVGAGVDLYSAASGLSLVETRSGTIELRSRARTTMRVPAFVLGRESPAAYCDLESLERDGTWQPPTGRCGNRDFPQLFDLTPRATLPCDNQGYLAAVAALDRREHGRGHRVIVAVGTPEESYADGIRIVRHERVRLVLPR